MSEVGKLIHGLYLSKRERDFKIRIYVDVTILMYICVGNVCDIILTFNKSAKMTFCFCGRPVM